MNESKIPFIHTVILNGMPEGVVTHADYKALEEKWKYMVERDQILTAELASLKERFKLDGFLAEEILVTDKMVDAAQDAYWNKTKHDVDAGGLRAAIKSAIQEKLRGRN